MNGTNHDICSVCSFLLLSSCQFSFAVVFLKLLVPVCLVCAAAMPAGRDSLCSSPSWISSSGQLAGALKSRVHARRRGRRGRPHQLRRSLRRGRRYSRTLLLSHFSRGDVSEVVANPFRAAAVPRRGLAVAQRSGFASLPGPCDLVRGCWAWLRDCCWNRTFSCCFTGLGTAELALESLLRWHRVLSGRSSELTVLWSVDYAARSLGMLHRGPAVHLGGDLLDLWPSRNMAQFEYWS